MPLRIDCAHGCTAMMFKWRELYGAFYAAGAVALLAAFGLGVWVGW